MKTTRRTRAQIVAANLTICAEMYANACNGCPEDSPFVPQEKAAAYWLNGAAAHMVKTMHYMGILQDILAK